MLEMYVNGLAAQTCGIDDTLIQRSMNSSASIATATTTTSRDLVDTTRQCFDSHTDTSCRTACARPCNLSARVSTVILPLSFAWSVHLTSRTKQPSTLSFQLPLR
jgi:hypothetical protein